MSEGWGRIRVTGGELVNVVGYRLIGPDDWPGERREGADTPAFQTAEEVAAARTTRLMTREELGELLFGRPPDEPIIVEGG